MFKLGVGCDWNDQTSTLVSDRPDHWFEKEETVPLSTTQTRREWAEYRCNTLDLSLIEVLGRAPVKTIAKLGEAWSAFEQAMYANGYGDASIVSSYVCRRISGLSTYSLHSYRLANDIDPPQNWRQGSGAAMDWSKCKLTRAQSDAVERIRTISGAQVFRNGWVFSNPDPMHFQIACTQGAIGTGIDWDTVDGDGTVPPEVGGDDMFCKYGDGFGSGNYSANTAYWQLILLGLDVDIDVDGKYGNDTASAVASLLPSSDGQQVGPVEASELHLMVGELGGSVADAVVRGDTVVIS